MGLRDEGFGFRERFHVSLIFKAEFLLVISRLTWTLDVLPFWGYTLQIYRA